MHLEKANSELHFRMRIYLLSLFVYSMAWWNTSDSLSVLNKKISFIPIFIERLPEDTCNNKLLFSQSKNFRPQFEKGERVDFSCCLRNHLIDWMFFFLRKMKQQKFQLRLKNLRWKKDWTGEVPFFFSYFKTNAFCTLKD